MWLKCKDRFYYFNQDAICGIGFVCVLWENMIFPRTPQLSMRKIKTALLAVLLTFAFSECHQPVTDSKVAIQRIRVKPANSGYHFEKPKDWLNKNNNGQQQNIVLAVNRTDSAHLAKMDSIIVPNDLSGDLEYYLPFPLSVPGLKDIKKIIFFSYPAQIFVAYEAGELVYTGPVNMGRKTDPTPTGLYYTNWKAEKTTSTFNDEWDLKWNFNIENKLGIGFHQYDLPGYPASHSCLRLLEKDARYLYDWADQWKLDDKNKDSILANGTPVIVFGSYSFDGPKPWLQLLTDAHILDISSATVQQLAAPFMADIMAKEEKRVATATRE